MRIKVKLIVTVGTERLKTVEMTDAVDPIIVIEGVEDDTSQETEGEIEDNETKKKKPPALDNQDNTAQSDQIRVRVYLSQRTRRV